ncbi:MAG: hypothetical protein GWN01_09605 [Nitrosopumilaceae archaeon]|nr:hypothetical protein [Nitrosopumilaceae archaeon]NIU01160.1 hypothetical protein [Nitrosopumilaceae archaeon]NIU87529.1 hypothetical protein [Nitrosopumilaceae archaeon]NIV65994.1 hypothetical protein [Nitrosopumilaceae archaeon]NIX61762.1 hypothetical protein [Nitrosopumilaceae archaeon]
MGNLVVLGIVSSIGSVILFHGLDEINAFSYDLSFHDSTRNDGLREDIVFEHIYFKPGSDDVEISLLNVGSIDSTLDRITIVKSDTQEIIVDRKDVGSLASPDDSLITINGEKTILITTTALGSSNWDDPYYVDSEYKISLTTSRNNFFSTVAVPFNT